MRKLTLALAATTALAIGAGAAQAQTWQNINARQAMLEERIENGMRSGQLTRVEARNLRAEFNALMDLEARYRINGLSYGERADLDQRFDRLAMRVRFERTDGDQRNWYGGRGWTDNRGQWVNIERRKIQLDRRIEQGLRSGQLTRAEAVRLRADFDAIARMEARYRLDGLSMRERADLDRRFDTLAQRIRWERRDDQRRYGYNRY